MLENCINLRTEISRIIKELEVLSVQYTIKKMGLAKSILQNMIFQKLGKIICLY